MVEILDQPAPAKLSLRAATADELMVGNPISLRYNASVRDAIALLTDRGFNVAPVVDDGGRPVGVVSVTDILIHNREQRRCYAAGDESLVPERRHLADLLREDAPAGFADPAVVEDIMTPAVFTVRRDTSATEVVRLLLAHRVHHLFVADDEGILVGVIGMSDVLRHLD